MASLPEEVNGTPSSVPITMRGWAHTACGLPTNILKLTTDLPVPKIKTPTDVLIKIRYAALNPGVSVMMQFVPMIFRTKPSIPEFDFSGTIAQLGSAVPSARNLKVGVAVFGSIPLGSLVKGGQGALAEYVVVPADNVCVTPEGTKQEEAAGLGIAGATALSLLDGAKLKAGEKVLVYGASGGCGSLALQLAKDAVGVDGKVVAVCSERNFGMVKSLGADAVVDYREHDPVHEYLIKEFGAEPFDAIIDAYGSQPLFLHCTKYLKPGRTFVSIGVQPPAGRKLTFWGVLGTVGHLISNSFWPAWLGGVNRPYFGAKGFPTLKTLESVADLVRAGKLRVPLDSSWEMEDALKGYEILLAKRARGKIIVKVEKD